MWKLWNLIGRVEKYPDEWALGLLNSIYETGDIRIPHNYRPVCMLSNVRKVIEGKMDERILGRNKVNVIQLGFLKGCYLR